MATPAERLEAAYADVLGASGPDFFRSLRDYVDLLSTDKKIKKAVEQLRSDVKEAEAGFVREDDAFVSKLVPIRKALTERAPEADDSDQTRPAYNPADRVSAEATGSWTWTLANFDAIVDGREDKIIEKDGLDGSRSRMLVAILRAKLHDLVIPFNEKPAPRTDLRDLYDDMNEIGRQEVATHRRLEGIGEESGILGLLHLEHVVAHLDPKPALSLRTPEDKRQAIEQALIESDLAYLREAMRPREARGSLSRDAQKAVDRHEDQCRAELGRLHRPLKKRLERHRHWPRVLAGRIGWMPPVIGFVVDLAGFVALVAIAVGFVAELL